jgi:hypothetical protein
MYLFNSRAKQHHGDLLVTNVDRSNDAFPRSRHAITWQPLCFYDRHIETYR